jgi:23S rRNA pseudouridine1911/1915/1917 synthase
VRSRNGNRMMSVSRGGREALTRYRVLEAFSGAALLEVHPVTGRSHQIRIHLAESGCPLLGDVLYGGPQSLDGLEFERHLLHSWQLALQHPVTGDDLLLEAPLPADMNAALEALRDDNS